MHATIEVKGMTCGHCEKAVEGALKELKGISKIEVHLATGEVDVVYDDQLVTLHDMREAIENQGYDVIK